MPALVTVIGFGVAILVSWQIETGNAIAAIFNPSEIRRLLEEESMVFMQFALRALFLGLVITFPAAMYFTFEKQRGAALRTRFLLDAFRLDHRFRTVNDIRARYGARMRDVFGADGDSRGESGPSRTSSLRYNAPILISTMSISLVVVLVYAFYEGDSDVGFTVPLLNFLPYPYVVTFALLGAYFYGLNTAIRGYVRGDLQPKTYSQITGRIMKVFVLSALIWIVDVYWLPQEQSIPTEEVAAGDESLASSLANTIEGSASQTWLQGALLALAFFVGIVPNTFLTWFFEKTRKVFKLDDAKFVEAQPLTHLQGVDLYDRARLEQEGVTNLEALTHGELVDLMLQTRIPTGRLVDWLDQAALLLYVEGVPKGEGRDNYELAALLRDVGIRTASQLLCDCRGLNSWNEQDCASLLERPLTSAELNRFCDELTFKVPNQERLRRALPHAVRGVAGEPCLRRVLSWRTNPRPCAASLDAETEDCLPAHCHLTGDVRASLKWPDSPSSDAFQTQRSSARLGGRVARDSGL